MPRGGRPGRRSRDGQKARRVGEIGLEELGVVGDAVAVAVRAVVDSEDVRTVREEALGEVGADEAGPAVTSMFRLESDMTGDSPTGR